MQQSIVLVAPSYIESTFVALALLDAFDAITVFCLCEDKADTVWGHRQMLNHYIYSSFLSLAFNHLVRYFAEFAYE